MIGRTILFSKGDCFPTFAFVKALQRQGSEMLQADSVDHLLTLLGRFSPDCAIVLCAAQVDTQLVRIAEQVRRLDQHCLLLVVTSKISTEGALSALRARVSDLLEENTSPHQIIARLKSFSRSTEQFRITRSISSELLGSERMVGHGEAMVRLREQIARIAATSANVLITGESGTGKELAAELIHRNSGRSSRPFVAVNCAALPDTLLESELFGHTRGAFTGANAPRAGKLEHVAGGTLFLDEVGDMSLPAQAKILRAVETHVIQRLGSNADMPIDVRVVAATNQDLESLVREKKFRQDLYYRLNVVRLRLPPLRDRREDIPELIEYMLRELTQHKADALRLLERDVIYRLQSHEWPGNVRELRNVLESILVFSSSSSIGLSDLPTEILQTLRMQSTSSLSDRSKILKALDSVDWNRNDAAKILCCSRMTLYRKMAKYSIPASRRSQ